MKSIATKNSIVYFNAEVYSALNTYVETTQPSKIFVLTDTNTHNDCLPKFLAELNSGDITVEVMEMPEGEDHKTIDICTGVWEALSNYNADRKSLLINLGGGVVTDLGGFVASTFMRGIPFVNIPTSLLAMVDASVGGKTGVDLGALKNQVGIFNEGVIVGIDTSYLDTLSKNHMVSGFAEMLKHGLIYDAKYWNTLTHLENLDISALDGLIYNSVEIKNTVVSQDLKENGLRKILNFGHTLGHAVESYFLSNADKNPLLHGEAIAVGMILEAYLSHKTCGLSEAGLTEIKQGISKTFTQTITLDGNDKKHIINLLQYDKKNSYGVVNFVLLNKIGDAKIDCKVEESLIYEAFDFYSER